MATILDFSRPHVLRNEQEFNAAVDEIDRLLDLDVQPGTVDYERLEFLSVLVRAYEQEHYPDIWESSSPQDMI